MGFLHYNYAPSISLVNKPGSHHIHLALSPWIKMSRVRSDASVRIERKGTRTRTDIRAPVPQRPESLILGQSRTISRK